MLMLYWLWLKSLCDALFVGQQPLNGTLQILLHVLLFLVAQFQHHFLIGEVFLDVQLDLLEDLALDVLCYLLLLVSSRLQAFVKGFVLAAHEDHKVEEMRRKGVRAVEIEQQSSRLNIIILRKEVSQFVLIKLWHIELLVPILIKLMVDDQLANRKIGEVERLIQQLTKGSFSCSRSASDDDVGGLARSVLGYHDCWYYNGHQNEAKSSHGQWYQLGLDKGQINRK